MIYLIVCPAMGACKIGFTDSLKNRLTQLQIGCPDALIVHFLVDGSKSNEKQLHEKFKQFKMRGEWFHYNETIKRFFSGLFRYNETCIDLSDCPKNVNGMAVTLSKHIVKGDTDAVRYARYRIQCYRKIQAQRN